MFDQPVGVQLRQALLADGYTDDELRQRRRRGELTVLRRGVYLSPAGTGELTVATRHALLVAAEVPRVAPEAVVSHVSAAILHGLPVFGLPMQRVHVTRSRRNGARRGSAVHVHAAPLDADEVVDVGGFRVTSVARTVADLGRSSPFEPAVVVADAALRAGKVDPPGLLRALVRAKGWPGVPAARRVVVFADARSESVGESRSRVAIHRACLPAPTPQWEVWRGERLLGRCDFGWPGQNVVGEFDGAVKYGRLLRPGQEPGDAVFEEKVREDDLRAHGLTVIRWIWRDLASFQTKADQLRAALGAK